MEKKIKFQIKNYSIKKYRKKFGKSSFWKQKVLTRMDFRKFSNLIWEKNDYMLVFT